MRSNFQVVDQDGRWVKIDHFLLHAHAGEEEGPLLHCLADPNPDVTTSFLCKILFCNTFLAWRNMTGSGAGTKVVSCWVPNVSQLLHRYLFCLVCFSTSSSQTRKLSSVSPAGLPWIMFLTPGKTEPEICTSFLVHCAPSQVEGGLSPWQSGFLCPDPADCSEMPPAIELNFASIIVPLAPDSASGGPGIEYTPPFPRGLFPPFM